jgi:hypothetical protein
MPLFFRRPHGSLVAVCSTLCIAASFAACSGVVADEHRRGTRPDNSTSGSGSAGAGGADGSGGNGPGVGGSTGSGGEIDEEPDATSGAGGYPPIDVDGGTTPPGDSGPHVSDPVADCFGTKKIYATLAGGREWCLPDTADQTDAEWEGGGDVKRGTEPGVFHVDGSPRIPVSSPADKPWWRNVEITVYLRLIKVIPGTTIAPEWQLYARGERHSNGTVSGPTINRGRLPPAGTPTWPGYPYAGNINGHCLASAYKGYLNVDGTTEFKKEISHTNGYTNASDRKTIFPGGVPSNKWVGFKTVIRNFNHDTAVHMESWIDKNADGNWTKASEVDDTGGWRGGASNPDGCGAAPFGYKDDQTITWAGPHVTLRFDNLSCDFKAMSAREIDPLP